MSWGGIGDVGMNVLGTGGRAQPQLHADGIRTPPRLLMAWQTGRTRPPLAEAGRKYVVP